MRCEEEFGGRKRRASTILDDQAKRTDPNARCRTFFSAVGAHIMSGAKGEAREKNCRKTAEEEWPDPVIHLDCMFMRGESAT